MEDVSCRVNVNDCSVQFLAFPELLPVPYIDEMAGS